MMDWILFFVVGLVVGWNLLPQPLFIKKLYDKISVKFFKKDTKVV